MSRTLCRVLVGAGIGCLAVALAAAYGAFCVGDMVDKYRQDDTPLWI